MRSRRSRGARGISSDMELPRDGARAAAALALRRRAHRAHRPEPGARAVPGVYAVISAARLHVVRAVLRARAARPADARRRCRALRGRAGGRGGRRGRGDGGGGARSRRDRLRGAAAPSSRSKRRWRRGRRWCTRASRWPATSPISRRCKSRPGTNICHQFDYRRGQRGGGVRGGRASCSTTRTRSRASSTTRWSRTGPSPTWDDEGGLTVWSSTQNPVLGAGRAGEALRSSREPDPHRGAPPRRRVRRQDVREARARGGRAGPDRPAAREAPGLGGGCVSHGATMQRPGAREARLPPRWPAAGTLVRRRLRRRRLRRHRAARDPEGHLHGQRSLPRGQRAPAQQRGLHQHDARRRLPRLWRPAARVGGRVDDGRRRRAARSRSRRSASPEPARTRRGVRARRHAGRRQARGEPRPRGRGDPVESGRSGRTRPRYRGDDEGERRAVGVRGHRAPARRRQRLGAREHGGDGARRSDCPRSDRRGGARDPARTGDDRAARHRASRPTTRRRAPAARPRWWAAPSRRPRRTSFPSS